MSVVVVIQASFLPEDGARPHLFDARSPTAIFAEIHGRYFGDLRRFVQFRVHDPHLAEDIAQETFLRAFRAAGAIDGTRPPWPWLQVIAQNIIANRLRDESRAQRYLVRRVELAEVESEIDPGSDGDPEEWLSKQHRDAAISASLETLTERERRVLLLRVVDELSYQEIAQVEGVSIDASKSVLKRARRSFRTAYEALQR